MLARWYPHVGIRRALVTANVVVLLVAVAPFVLWEAAGPPRFEALELGEAPAPRATGERSVIGERGEPLASAVEDGGLVAPEVLLDLGPHVSVTLVFSVGSRGLSDDEARRLRVVDLDARGADGLADTIMLLVADRATGRAALLSIPRDLWLYGLGHKINASFNLRGTQGLVDAVSRVTGLPVHHVVRLNFEAFADLVDAAGGVDLSIDRAMADVHSVLWIPRPGCWHFGGTEALAFVRSRRTLARTSAGTWVTDHTASDFGRIVRQQRVLGAIWDRIRGPSVVTRIPALLGAARRGLVVDEDLGLQELRDLASSFGDVAAGRVEGYTLPTVSRRIGRAAALVLDEAEARPMLSRLRAWPPDGADPSALVPGRGTPALAAGTELALPATDACHESVARPLPDPFDALAEIAAGRDPEPPPAETEEPGPSEPATPSDDGTPPSEEPTADPEPSDGPVPLPTRLFPGRGG